MPDELAGPQVGPARRDAGVAHLSESLRSGDQTPVVVLKIGLGEVGGGTDATDREPVASIHSGRIYASGGFGRTTGLALTSGADLELSSNIMCPVERWSQSWSRSLQYTAVRLWAPTDGRAAGGNLLELGHTRNPIP